MIIAIIYLSIGFLVGMLFKYEIDNRRMKKRLAKKITFARAVGSSSKIKEYDTILYAIKAMNENLALNENSMKKEVQ